MLTITQSILLTFSLWILKIQKGYGCSDPYYDSYCVAGLDIGENAFWLCSEYEYAGIRNCCKYFVNVEYSHNVYGNNVYIYWNDYNNYWNIGPDIYESSFYAYCDETSLDLCGYGDWNYYDGEDTNLRYSLRAYQCSYNNSECEQDIEEYYSDYSSNDVNINNEDNTGNSDRIMEFCVRNSNYRDFNTLSGKFEPNGSCVEEEPVYIHESKHVFDQDFSDIFGYNASLIVTRDEELDSWVFADKGDEIFSYEIFSVSLKTKT